MRWLSLIVILTVVFIAGCSAFEDPSQKATQNAENTAFARTVSAVEVQVETMVYLQQTAEGVEIMSAQLTQVVNDRNRLATQVAGGVSVPNPNINQNTGTDGSFVVSPPPNGVPTAIGGGPPAGIQPSPSLPNSTQYLNPVTTDTINETTFCAVGTVTTFEMGTNLVYFVVQAQQLSAGINFTLRITPPNNTPVQDTNFWVSDGYYDQTCIYYGIDQNNIDFSAGTYRVELLANQVVAAEAQFTIQ